MSAKIIGTFAGGLTTLGDKQIQSGISKIEHPYIQVTVNGVEKDQIINLKNHGGPHRAINLYSFEYYELLKNQFPNASSPFTSGGMGENITTNNLLDATTHVGDIYKIGTAIIQISQPRAPCWKLDAKFNVDDLAKNVQKNYMTGAYARVIEPGIIAKDDSITLIERDSSSCSIATIWKEIDIDRNIDNLVKISKIKALSPEWVQIVEKKIATYN